MLEIKGANKYFNKGKKNQIKAIDNTTITLGNAGLVALLGPSGCGKTTLLNAIGGLDKLKSGKIYIDGNLVNSKLTYKTDKIRNLNIGYIFQDYKLIENLSVYDNVAIVLKMIGIKDKKEIKTRVEYTLDKVGMLRYKKRPVSMLSGGERQRVGIARAIVKAPNIILADEPTGNLDSKNSLEVMKIIKAISKDRLVILVTHEQDLARFYASRIIEIKDGKVINDYENKHDNDLDYQLDNTFYLKDFKEKQEFTSENCNINIYTNNKEKVNVDIVVSGDNIYIKSNTSEKIRAVDSESDIEFIDEHYKKIAKKDADKYKFDFHEIINKDIKKKYSSILNPVTLLVNGFKKVFNFSILKKILLGGFFLSGMFLMYAVSSIFGTLKIDDTDFTSYNKNYLMISQKNTKVTDFLSFENKEEVNYVLPGDSLVDFTLNFKNYYQTSKMENKLSGSLASLNLIKESDLLYGKMPENDYEIVIDKMIFDRLFKSDNSPKMAGIFKEEDFLNQMVSLPNMKEFKIAGITDLQSPSIYASNNMFINIIANSSIEEDNSITDYTLYQDKIELKKGHMPTSDYEVIVSIDMQESMPLNKEINKKVNNHKLKVVGYYDSKYSYNLYLTSNNTVKYNLITTRKNVMINSNDNEKTLNDLQSQNFNIRNAYEKSKDAYLKERKEQTNAGLFVALVILVISLIEIFLMMRSSFLSRVKEIGIYRAVGVKKSDIYKIFFGEIFAITTLASLPGIIFMAYILNTLSKATVFEIITKYFVINPFVVIITLVFVYLFNLIIGLLPVYTTLRKTPAQILSRYDID